MTFNFSSRMSVEWKAVPLIYILLNLIAQLIWKHAIENVGKIRKNEHRESNVNKFPHFTGIRIMDTILITALS